MLHWMIERSDGIAGATLPLLLAVQILVLVLLALNVLADRSAPHRTPGKFAQVRRQASRGRPVVDIARRTGWARDAVRSLAPPTAETASSRATTRNCEP